MAREGANINMLIACHIFLKRKLIKIINVRVLEFFSESPIVKVF